MGASLVSVMPSANMRPVPAYISQVLRQPASALALENAAGFGRWWVDKAKGQFVLSPLAAEFLNVPELHHCNCESALVQVFSEDMAAVSEQISGTAQCAQTLEFRVISANEGIRWLRITQLPDCHTTPLLRGGILSDITPLKHAAMRERLAFELTEFLAGSHSLEAAVTNVIQLICKNLGWDWGAYWAAEPSPGAPETVPHLRCRSFWHRPELDLAAFSRECANLSLQAGEGLVGSVWQIGQPKWAEEGVNEAGLLERCDALDYNFRSGYVFPVTHRHADGRIHSPGVLAFYSHLSRQPEAQLPRLSASIGAFIAQMADRIEQQAITLHLAQVDSLTGLTNRSHFHHLVSMDCANAASAGTTFGLAFIDLDRFKPINDAFGHEAGNQVLREFARRLQALAPPGARIGRLGGDEFAMLIPQAALADAATLLEQILQAAREPFTYEEFELTLSASAGVSTYPLCGTNCASLLQSADAAMYRIKNNGRNGCHFTSIKNTHNLVRQQSSLAQRLALESDLHHALEGNEFSLVYQPIFDICGQDMLAIEALLRWRRPDGSVVPPEVFIPIAEQSHLIVEIGRWVVRQACCDLARLRSANFKTLKLHVNMAASEFTNKRLPAELLATLGEFGLEAQSLVLELTEGMLMKRPDQVIPVMRSLRQSGIGISLDDFGMGHSSLSMLKNLPISSLKIDRSFVRDLPLKASDRAIVKTIVDLGFDLALQVIAEGIETGPQLEALRQSGCRLVQGYLLALPMPLQDLLTTCTSQV